VVGLRDPRARAVSGDGFAYSHYHEDHHCGLVAEEATSLDLQDTTACFSDLAAVGDQVGRHAELLRALDLLMERACR